MQVVGIFLAVSIGCSWANCGSSGTNSPSGPSQVIPIPVTLNLAQVYFARTSTVSALRKELLRSQGTRRSLPVPAERAPVNVGKPGGPRAKPNDLRVRDTQAAPKPRYEIQPDYDAGEVESAVAPAAPEPYQLSKGNSKKRRPGRRHYRRAPSSSRKHPVITVRTGGPRKESSANSNRPDS
ncbi:MAG TPA: hypothetical protein VMZ30_07095 [Pyrinomonadaceae bacterium]|nr:hypothetical protein [Pyrinomonadaceae bacterium]